MENKNNTIGILVYKDTITLQYEGDNNLCLLMLPNDFVKQYASKNIDYNTFEEWKENYTADETQDLFSLVVENEINHEVVDY